jgi:hypothetical protein
MACLVKKSFCNVSAKIDRSTKLIHITITTRPLGLDELACLGIDARNSIGVPSSFSFHLPVPPHVNLDNPPQKREHNDIVALVFRKENFIDLY